MSGEAKEPVPALLVDLVMAGVYAYRHSGVRVAQGGLVHRLADYNARRALWEFYCEDVFCGDAHVQRESFDAVTCVACFVRMPWFTRSGS